MINIDEPWPDWAGSRQSYRTYAVHYPYTLASWEKKRYDTPKTLCNTQAANMYTRDEKKVSCGRCRASLGLSRY